ncbi:hypothetical protein JCM6882_005827 [Rhodosporidiobolus microsporus]
MATLTFGTIPYNPSSAGPLSPRLPSADHPPLPPPASLFSTTAPPVVQPLGGTLKMSPPLPGEENIRGGECGGEKERLNGMVREEGGNEGDLARVIEVEEEQRLHAAMGDVEDGKGGVDGAGAVKRELVEEVERGGGDWTVVKKAKGGLKADGPLPNLTPANVAKGTLLRRSTNDVPLPARPPSRKGRAPRSKKRKRPREGVGCEQYPAHELGSAFVEKHKPQKEQGEEKVDEERAAFEATEKAAGVVSEPTVPAPSLPPLSISAPSTVSHTECPSPATEGPVHTSGSATNGVAVEEDRDPVVIDVRMQLFVRGSGPIRVLHLPSSAKVADIVDAVALGGGADCWLVAAGKKLNPEDTLGNALRHDDSLIELRCRGRGGSSASGEELRIDEGAQDEEEDADENDSQLDSLSAEPLNPASSTAAFISPVQPPSRAPSAHSPASASASSPTQSSTPSASSASERFLSQLRSSSESEPLVLENVHLRIFDDGHELFVPQAVLFRTDEGYTLRGEAALEEATTAESREGPTSLLGGAEAQVSAPPLQSHADPPAPAAVYAAPANGAETPLASFFEGHPPHPPGRLPPIGPGPLPNNQYQNFFGPVVQRQQREPSPPRRPGEVAFTRSGIQWPPSSPHGGSAETMDGGRARIDEGRQDAEEDAEEGNDEPEPLSPQPLNSASPTVQPPDRAPFPHSSASTSPSSQELSPTPSVLPVSDSSRFQLPSSSEFEPLVLRNLRLDLVVRRAVPFRADEGYTLRSEERAEEAPPAESREGTTSLMDGAEAQVFAVSAAPANLARAAFEESSPFEGHPPHPPGPLPPIGAGPLPSSTPRLGPARTSNLYTA